MAAPHAAFRHARALALTIRIHSAPSELRSRISTPWCAFGSITGSRGPLECASCRVARDARRKSLPGKHHTQSGVDAHRLKAQHFSSLRAPVVHTLHRAFAPRAFALTGEMHSVPSDPGRGYPQSKRHMDSTLTQRAMSVHGRVRHQRQTPESRVDSACARALTIRFHSVSTEWKGRLSTFARRRAASASPSRRDRADDARRVSANQRIRRNVFRHD